MAHPHAPEAGNGAPPGNPHRPGPRFADAAVTIRYARDQGTLPCTVADDGRGFPPDMPSLGWLREPDPRTHLGLAIVVAAVEASGGHVRRENAPEGGARVTIRLPAAWSAGRQAGPWLGAAPGDTLVGLEKWDLESGGGSAAAHTARPRQPAGGRRRARTLPRPPPP